jgi:hypothetical protein
LADLLARFSVPDLRLAGRRVSVSVLLLVAGLLVWGGWQVAVMGRLFVFMNRHPTTGGYGVSLKYTRAAAQEARRLAGDAEVIVLGTGTNPAMHENPSIFDALLFGQAHRFADGRWALPTPDSSEVVYLVGLVQERDSADLWPVLQHLEAMEHVRPGPVIALPDGWDYRIFHRSGPDREDVLAGLTRFPGDISFANGTVFMGYGMPGTVAAGETLEVWLAWWVRSPPPAGASYHFFAHLLDADGRLCSQYDGAGFPTSAWRAGDLVSSRFPIPVPGDLTPGRYSVWAGLYVYPEVVNVSFLDVAGNPAGDRVVLGDVLVE